ncbi:MAG TPA: hypothetical protein VFS27_03385 [Blastocatellia bacterium]|nr:hypothetical protein [Blastocatellia bacterium]
MLDETVEKSTIRQYLLGELPEPEAERIERWYFAGGKAIDEIWAAFCELAEERLGSELSENEAEKFDLRLRSSPAMREMFEHEKTIRDYAAGQAADSRQAIGDDQAGASRRESRLSAVFFKSPRLVAAGLGALAGLVLLWGFWGFRLALRAPEISKPERGPLAQEQNQKDPNGVAQPSTPATDPRRPPLAADAANGGARKEEKIATTRPDTGESGPAGAGREAMVTLLLLAGGTRGDARGKDEYPTLEIPGRTETVLLELEPPTDDCSVFSAVLQTESGEELQRWERLQARRSHSALRLARMRVHAGSLKNSGYVIRLECVPRVKNSASQAEYHFKVEKK